MFDKVVGDIMIPIEKYPHISYWDTLLHAMKLIEEIVIEVDGKQSLPRVLLVFGKDNNLVGMVRRRDILKGLEPKFLVKQSIQNRIRLFDAKENPKFANIDNKRILKGVMERVDTQIGNVMLPIQATINFEDHIFKAVYVMNLYKVSQLPVIKDDEVVGVVRTVEIFKTVSEVLLSEDYIW